MHLPTLALLSILILGTALATQQKPQRHGTRRLLAQGVCSKENVCVVDLASTLSDGSDYKTLGACAQGCASQGPSFVFLENAIAGNGAVGNLKAGCYCSSHVLGAQGDTSSCTTAPVMDAKTCRG